MARSLRRWLVWAGLFLLLCGLFAGAALVFGTRLLKAQVEQALGPNAQIGAIELHWNAVEIDRLRLRAAPGWPTGDELRADRIRIEPDLLGLLSRQVRISRILIEGGYVSALRGREGGLRLLPSLLERPTVTTAAPLPPVVLDAVRLEHCTLTLFDASIRRPPLPITFSQLQVDVGPIRLPERTGQTRLNLQGDIEGNHHTGRIDLQGWIELANMDSSLATRLRGVDLVTLQPYLVKAAQTGVKAGTLDLDLDVQVRSKQLHAPGSVTLHGLELTEGGGFLGLPRQGVMALMKDRHQDIAFRFELDGRIDDPKFRLNENLAARMGTALAGSLGISLEGVAEGAGRLGGTLGEAATGIGQAFKGLFGH